MGIGRPLYVAQKKSALSADAQAKTAVETPEKTILTKVGHALPADEKDNSHIIISPKGEMVYIEGILPSVSIPSRTRYENLFSQTGTELLPELLLPDGEKGETILDSLKRMYASGYGYFPIRSLVDGRLPENYPHVKQLFEQSLIFAQERKDAVEANREQMRRDVVAGLRKLFDPPPSPPPAVSPPAAPAVA